MPGSHPPPGPTVPEHLVLPLVQTVIIGLATRQRRDGCLPLSGQQLAAWVSDLHRSLDGTAPATVVPQDRDDRIGTLEASRILGCSQRNVGLLVKRRWLDSERIGRVLILKRRQVLDYAERRTDAPDSD